MGTNKEIGCKSKLIIWRHVCTVWKTKIATVNQIFHWCITSTNAFISHWTCQSMNNRQTKTIVHRKGSCIVFIYIVRVILWPSFKNRDMCKSTSFWLTDLVSFLHVWRHQLKHVNADIIHGIYTDTIKVGILILITKDDLSPVHKVIQLVKHLCLNNWVWVINIAWKQELITSITTALNLVIRQTTCSCLVKLTVGWVSPLG